MNVFQKKFSTDSVMSSLPLSNCKRPEEFNTTFNTQQFQIDQQPKLQQYPHKHINTLYEFPSAGFYSVENECNSNIPGWQTKDGRTIDARGQRLTFNQRPDVSYPLFKDTEVDTKLDGYGQNYKTFKDITAGQYKYYTINREPVSTPVFVIQSNVSSEVFQDPMGALKPQYNRSRITRELRQISDYQFDRDQIEFRESITASLMRKNQQRDWNTLWDPIINKSLK